MPEALGFIIRTARKRRGWGVATLDAHTGISGATISRSFKKSCKEAPGIRLTVGRHGVSSVRLGGQRAGVNSSNRGAQGSVLAGHEISYRTNRRAGGLLGLGLLPMLLALAGTAMLLSWPAPAAAQPGERCFPETGHCVAGPFLAYWDGNGGLPVFGFPITPARPESNRDTGETYLTQWFERNRFELHGAQVLLGRLGDDRLRQLGVDWRTQPKGAPVEGCDFFPETEHILCDQATGLGFKSYWNARGGLAFFGFPLTETRVERNAAGDTVLTQWFERARFEWHPGNPDRFKVLLGLLGREVGPPTITPPVPPPPRVPAAACPSLTIPTGAGVQVAAAVSNAAPAPRSDVTVCALIVADGQPVAGAPMVSVWRYLSSTPTCAATSDATGLATCTRSIGAATVGYEVVIRVTFTHQGRSYTTMTSFIPR